MNKTVCLPDGRTIPAIGQGTWFLGERRDYRKQEAEALCAGIDAGMTLIDTAEMYGEGKAEELVGEVIRGYDRADLFLVSKVYPHNAGRRNIFQSCMASLKRMGTDYLDLYLLHWRGGIPLAETVACMEQLQEEGKIRRWGVSNFDTSDMEELWRVPGGKNCAVNQVLNRIAKNHRATVSQVLLAFVIREGDVIAIPRTGKAEHAVENAGGSEIVLTQEELAAIGWEFPAPKRKVYLDIV